MINQYSIILFFLIDIAILFSPKYNFGERDIINVVLHFLA
ncbi:hypothetical protein DSUL_60133 [Desulfovibrionales bacterium]